MKKWLKKAARNILLPIDRFHWFWLLLTAPFLLFPSPKRALFLLVVPILWLEHYLVSRYFSKSESFFPVTPLNPPLLVLMTMALISLWATYDILLSLEKISGFVLGLGVYFSVIRVGENPLGWWLSLGAFLGGGFAWAGISFFAMDYQIRFSLLAPLIKRVPRLLDTIPGMESGLHHNAVGGTLLWVLPLFLVFSGYTIATFKNNKPFYGIIQILKEQGRMRKDIFPNEERRGIETTFVQRIIKKMLLKLKDKMHFLDWFLSLALWIATLFSLFILILSQSRGSYLALGFTLALILFISISPKWRWILIICLLLLIIIFITVIFSNGGWDKIIFQLGLTEQAGFSISSLKGRFEIWRRAVYGIQDFPITGMGMNTFREVVHVLYPFFQISPDTDIAHAHNEFLQTALDLGIPGLVAFLSIYMISFWMLFRSWKNNLSSSGGLENSLSIYEHRIFYPLNIPQMLILGLGGCLFAHLLFGMTDAITLGAKPGIFFWMLLGLITSFHQLTSKGDLSFHD